MKRKSLRLKRAVRAALLVLLVAVGTTQYANGQSVATPTFSPAGGTYTEAQTVSIACATEGATIRYTLDGTEPTENSDVYGTPLDISETTTVMAKAWKDGYEASAVASATYTINIPDPVLTVAPTALVGFTYTYGSGPSEGLTVTVSGTYLTENVTVTAPESFEISLSDGNYSGTLTLVPESGTLSATTINVRMAAGLEVGDYSGDVTVTCGNQSQTVALSGSVSALPVAATPTFSPEGGTYIEAQTVSITCATEGATIHYTTDGTDPTENSDVYGTPLDISETTTVKAKAWKEGYEASAIASATYTIPLITIADAKALVVNQYALVQGVVNFIDNRNIYVEDATGGICLYLNSNTVPSELAMGDMVRAYGKRANFNGLFELSGINGGNANEFSIVSTGNELPLAVKTIAEILEGGADALQCTRVKIEGATIGTINTGGNTPLTQNGSTVNIYRVPTLSGIDEGDIVDVTGVVGYYNVTQMRVALASDVVLQPNPQLQLTIAATATPEEGGMVEGAGTYEYNTTCTLTATANEGYTFMYWTEDGEVVSAETPYSFTVKADRVLEAHFCLPLAVTASANPEAGGTVSGMGAYDYGTTCTLTATANEGYTFMYWTEDDEVVSSENPYSFTVTADRVLEAHFALPFTIAAEANPEEGGTVSGGGAYDYGTTCILSATANEGYTFMYWTEDGETVSNNANYSFGVTTERVLVANFSLPLTVSAVADSEEQGWVSGAGVFNYGEVCSLSATPNEGYSFINWTKNGEEVSTNRNFSFVVTEAGEYVAHFSLINFVIRAWSTPEEGGTVSFEGGQRNRENHYTRISDISELVDGSRVILAARYNETTNAYLALSNTLTSGKLTTTEFTSTMNGADETIPANIMADEDDYYWTLNVTADGYTFTNANGDVIGYGSSGTNFVMGGEKTHWNIDTGTSEDGALVPNYFGFNIINAVTNNRAFALRVTETNSVVGAYYNTSNMSNGQYNFFLDVFTDVFTYSGPFCIYDYGSTATVSATPNEGYAFVNWTENGAEVSAEPVYSFTVTSGRNLQANFAVAHTVSVTINPEEGGTVSGAGTYIEGTNCLLTAIPNQNYAFANWTINGNVITTSPTYGFVVNSDRTLVANFVPYTITATANPVEGGTVSGAGVYDIGEECTLTATANAGYTFINWTRDGEEVTTEATYSFTVTEAMAFVANFELNSYEITVTANPEAGGTVTGAGTYDHGATATLTATANEGYAFINWTQGGEIVSTEATYSFTVTEASAFVANFGLNSYAVTATASPAEGGTVTGAGVFLQGQTCTLTATANDGYTFINWTQDGEEVTTEPTYSFIVTEDAAFHANFAGNQQGSGSLGYTTYDWQSNAGAITRTVVWPDGKVNFAFTQATSTIYIDRGTGIGTYDAVNDEWIPSEGRVESEKTGFGSIARYGQNGIVVAAHTSTECGIYLIEDKDNITEGCAITLPKLENSKEPTWPVVMTSGPNRDIIHVLATAYSEDGCPIYYYRTRDCGQTWDKENVVLPFMTAEYALSWGSNQCYWMETTDDNCLALVVNNPWSDGMVIYSYDNGETWQRKVFYQHPNPFGTFDEMFLYPRWTSCQWDSQHHLHVLYEFNGYTGEPGFGSFYSSIGGVAYWNETMPYNLEGTTQSAIEGNLIPGQPFVLDKDYLYNDIYASWWAFSDVSHEMWPEYIGYLPPLDDDGNWEDPYTATSFNISDRSLHGDYNSGVCAFPVLCMVPGTDGMVAVWSAMDENHTDDSGNYYYKLFAAYSGDGGTSWTDMVHLTNIPEHAYHEFVYNQATVVGNKLIIASQCDGKTGTYVMSADNDPFDNYYIGLTYDLEELFGVVPTSTAYISATANPAEGGTVIGAGSYNLGATCTLTATANAGYIFINWTRDGEEVTTEPTYSFEVTEASAFVANFEQTAVTQTTDFASGWNWWSTYIDAGDVLTQLESGLTPNGQTIKSKSKSRVYRNGSWMGGLDAIESEGSYRVQTSAACTVDITGTATTPSAHPITLTPGWTWIGYPSTATMTVTEALANLTPTQGDVIKSKNKTAVYRNGAWMSSFTITPGTGLMYKSNAENNLTLTYPGGAKGDAAVEEADNLHWTPNASAYPSNMTVIAVVELDGAELVTETTEGYELAAFADGECRGSFRLMPVEGRCMAILTIAGDETAGLRFALYDAATGEEWHNAVQTLEYATDAVVGDIDAPYVVRFRSAGVDEWESSLDVYPNPVGRGQKVSLGLDAGTTGKVQVEIINALGVVVETRRATTAQTEITAPGVAGVYTLRIAVEGKGACHRKLVVR